MPDGNPRIPEGINSSDENPLLEFALLTLGVVVSLAVFVGLVSLLAGVLAPYVPFAWERNLEPVVEQFVDADANPDLEVPAQAVVQLAEALLQASLELPDDSEQLTSAVPPDQFRFHLLPSDSPNAFATFGGHVVVNNGLLREVSSENGLAMVIAHEIAHVQLRHPIAAAGRGIVIQLVLSTVLGSSGAGFLGGAINTGSALTMLSFNREMELAADSRALEILRRHYGHVGGADEFFLSMGDDKTDARWLEFTQTHPSIERRLAQIHEAMRSDVEALSLRPLPASLVQPPCGAVETN